jgi:hypothetical protein
MPCLLRLLFLAILVSMNGVIVWASLEQALFAIPREVFTNPWFIATLFDAYFAFITFFVWIAWREQTTGARLLWFISVILWGNVAMSLYMLRELWGVKTRADLDAFFTRRNPGTLALPLGLTLAGVAAYALGAAPLFR